MLLSAQLKYASTAKAQTTGKVEEWQLWEPYPIQQKLLDCDASLVGFGGSGGGSKTTAILFAAYLKHKKSLILRKTYPNLKEIIERSRELFHGSGGKYNSIDKMWRFPGGKNIEMGALQYEQEKDNYRGREHSGLFVDEVTELPGGWATLQFLMGWMRSPEVDQKCQCVITFNPPSTPEGEWIKEVFAAWIDPFHENPAESGEIRWFANIDGKDTEVEQTEPFELNGELIEPMSRTFIRATLEDNLKLKNTMYRQTLKSLPEPLRSQLLYGDMSLQMDDDAWQVIPSPWLEAAFWRYENSCPLNTALSCIGVDVARGGKDATVLAMRRGYWFEELKTYPGKSTPDGGAVAAQVANHWEEGCAINVDVLNVGNSVYDILKGTYPRVQAIGSGEKSHRCDRSGKLAFADKRAEMYWLFREALDPEHGDNLCIPRNSRLKAALCAPRWTLEPPTAGDESKKGRIRIESKDNGKENKKGIKARLGRSPDDADATVYCWANQLDVFEPIEYGLEVRDIAPKVPNVEVQPAFTVKRRGRGGWH
jgi:Terminase large subunit, T4likevirus-type, N-terminal